MELLALALGGVAMVALSGRPIGVLAPLAVSAVLAVGWAPAVIAASATILVAAVTALATIVVARRQRSGTVDTSEAADLWNFSRELMHDLREDLVKARERIAVLESEKVEDRARIDDLETEVRKLKASHS